MSQQAGQEAGIAAAPAKPLSADAVRWAFRLLIGRDPFSPEELELHRTLPDLPTLRRHLAYSWEFKDFFDVKEDGMPIYGMPIFLMRPPADPAFPFRFSPPNLDEPTGQMCTVAQFEDPAFAEIIEAMGMPPLRSRRSWEQAWIVSLLATHGMIGPGKHGIGFGVGRERIPSLLASRGVSVLASDTPQQMDDAAISPGAALLGLFHPEILHLGDFEQLVRYRHIDMNQLPADLDGQFDFCWSASALDRLGTLAAATAFLEDSLRVLRPGGIAAHTFALNVGSDIATAETPALSVLRRRDLEALAAQLQTGGHEVLPVNFHPGLEPQDAQVTTRPDAPLRPKQHQHGQVVTSFGLALRKAA